MQCVCYTCTNERLVVLHNSLFTKYLVNSSRFAVIMMGGVRASGLRRRRPGIQKRSLTAAANMAMANASSTMTITMSTCTISKNGDKPGSESNKTKLTSPKKMPKMEVSCQQEPAPFQKFQGLSCRKISAENLDCDYVKLYDKREASRLFDDCERELCYFTGDLTRIRVYGKWHNIPRKQVAHGDKGLTYTFSSVTVPAKPWTPLLERIRDRIQDISGQQFNFVLINRYKDGNDYVGEHRDDEKDLVRTSPIASLSLGQQRDFTFRHGESRGKNAKRNLPPITLELEHGSLLLMNNPTNVYWYHSLPVRRNAVGVRINMTFRHLKT